MGARHVRRSGPEKSKIVVFGGTGAIGANIVEQAGLDGASDIVVVGRKLPTALPLYLQDMFSSIGVEYVGGIDLAQSTSKQRITRIMAGADWTFYASGGYPLEAAQLEYEATIFRGFVAAATAAGYGEDNREGKVLVVADSALRIKNEPGANGDYQESHTVDVADEILVRYGIERRIPYLDFKIDCVPMLKGLAYRLVAPTSVVSAWSDHGPELEALPLYFNHPDYKWSLDRKFDTISGADVGKAFLAVARKGRNGDVYQAVGVPMSPADLIESGLEMAGRGRALGRSDVSDADLIAAINDPAGARRTVSDLRLLAQLWTFGLLDPVGLVPDVAFNPLFSLLALMLGEQRDGSKIARLGINRSRQESVLRDLKRQVMYLASNGRLPGSALDHTAYTDFATPLPRVQVRSRDRGRRARATR